MSLPLAYMTAVACQQHLRGSARLDPRASPPTRAGWTAQSRTRNSTALPSTRSNSNAPVVCQRMQQHILWVLGQ
eukprot:3339005-Rhodomonas_salina.1